MLRGRSVVEVMVLVFTAVIAGAIMVLSTAILIVEISSPEQDTGNASTALFNLISGMMGALLGLLAGKSDAVQRNLDTPLLPDSLDTAPVFKRPGDDPPL